MDGEEIEQVEEVKLLGVIISIDLKWSRNYEYTIKRRYTKLWFLTR